MEEITRFDMDMDGSMEPSEHGRWVRYEDVPQRTAAEGEDTRRAWVNATTWRGLTDEQLASLHDAFAQALVGVYVCGRVWEAWNYGTMSKGDFQPAGECEEVLDSLTTAVYEALKAVPPKEPEKQPVAWMDANDPNRGTAFKWKNIGYHNTPLYTTPPPVPEAHKLKPLTDEQIERCFAESAGTFVSAGRAIEAAHGIKEKNTSNGGCV